MLRDARNILAALLCWAALATPAAAGAALVFDSDTGRVLYSEDPDIPWYPASLTKMMTAYLAFEAIKEHRATPETRIYMSAEAHKMPPTRLGMKVGEDITLNDALRALIMKSANDVAVAIAETLGGDEMSFVKQMNQKAVELGMNSTHFINPHGLPAEQQITTARDMAILSQALLHDYPEYASLYSDTQATIGKRQIATHNAIIVSYPGGDGIKTGFTCASGYNLAASATRDGHRIIAILLGEPDKHKRTARAMALLDLGFRTREWKSLFPGARVENLPREIVGVGFEPDERMLKRYRVCKTPPPVVENKKDDKKKKTVVLKPKKKTAASN